MNEPLQQRGGNNQPPRNYHRSQVIGADSLLFPNVPIGSGTAIDTLIVPPPPPGVVRQVSLLFGPMCEFLNQSGEELNNVEIVLKKTTGEVSLTGGPSTLADGGTIAIEVPVMFMPHDPDLLGVFIRVEDDVATSGLSGCSSWQDVKNVGMQTTPMPDTSRRDVVASPPDGIARQLAYEGGPPPISAIFNNYDTAPHDVSIFVSDGVDDVPVLASGITVAAGLSLTVAGLLITLRPGWTVKAEMTGAVATQTPEIVMAYSDANLGPTPIGEGGAF